MGAYLSEPITEKISSDGDGERLKYGASSMQGWRVSQEDAHNCIIDFDKDTSLFAVYDGHGGHEVAVYTSQKLPEFIKNNLAYKKEDIENALINAFLEFDGTIDKRDVIEILKEIAGNKNDDSDEMSEEENISNLCEEASLPIEQVIEKYQSGVAANPNIKKLQGGTPNSPYLRAKSKENDAACSSSGSSRSSGSSGSSSGSGSSSLNLEEQAGSSAFGSGSSSGSFDSACGSSSVIKCGSKCDTSSDVNVVSSSISEVKKENGSGDAPETNHRGETAEVTTSTTLSKDSISPDSSNAAEIKTETTTNSDTKQKITETEPNQTNEIKTEVDKDTIKKELNGVVKKIDNDDTKNNEEPKGEDVSSSTTVQENGEVTNSSPKGKGKAKLVKKISESRQKLRQRTLRIRNAHQLYTKLLDMEESDSEDENDETFEGGEDFSSSELENEVNESDDADDENEEENLSDEELDGEEEHIDDEEDDEVDDDEDDEFARNIREEPGSDSGCTAVVAVVKGNKVFVANAGDSRCIICRDGQAVEMSLDHKPEDEPEMERIKKAGGKVTQDGRVNGGLNLSRAIGDHAYKQNKELSDREQMITALPDIKIHELNEKDEFMVLACDGIWNFMSSQEVVEFVRPRLAENQKLSTICEEMFDHCLAPNTMGDGTGCDNMTAIIIKFDNKNIQNTTTGCAKRSASPINESSEIKKIKVDNNQ